MRRIYHIAASGAALRRIGTTHIPVEMTLQFLLLDPIIFRHHETGSGWADCQGARLIHGYAF
jgi:hypothetical protein